MRLTSRQAARRAAGGAASAWAEGRARRESRRPRSRSTRASRPLRRTRAARAGLRRWSTRTSGAGLDRGLAATISSEFLRLAGLVNAAAEKGRVGHQDALVRGELARGSLGPAIVGRLGGVARAERGATRRRFGTDAPWRRAQARSRIALARACGTPAPHHVSRCRLAVLLQTGPRHGYGSDRRGEFSRGESSQRAA
jgi:hypothetical protein